MSGAHMTREFRKTATVHARQAQPGEVVRIETLEGPAVAEPGDWIVTANTERAEQWIVKAGVFEATYEPVDAAPAPDTGAVTAEQVEHLLADLADTIHRGVAHDGGTCNGECDSSGPDQLSLELADDAWAYVLGDLALRRAPLGGEGR